MTKSKIIISYDKLTIDQKKQILRDFPDGYINHMTIIKTPTGELLDALMWETDEVIYLVKIIVKSKTKISVNGDEEDEDEDDFEEEEIDEAKDDELDVDTEEEEDNYDKPEEDAEEEED